MVSPLQAPSLSSPPGRRAPSLVPDQPPARLSLERSQVGILGTELWLAPGIIRLARGFPTTSQLMESFWMEMVTGQGICRARNQRVKSGDF